MSDDLNALRTLVTLFETRSATATAQRLHVTQPTVSYTLGRLRRRFDDDLFRREGHTLVPTARATRLYDALSGPLASIENTVAQPEDFDPASLRGELLIALSSLGEISFLPTVAAAVAAQAPRLRLRVLPLDVDAVETSLLRGEVDLAVTMTVVPSERLWRRPFFEVEYVAVSSAAHPVSDDAHALAQRRFISVAGRGGHVFLREALHEHGLAEQVALVVNGYASVPHLLQGTDLVALLPRHFAEIFGRHHRLAIAALPWQVPSPPVALYTRRPDGLSPAQRWLGELAFTTLRTTLPRYPELRDDAR